MLRKAAATALASHALRFHHVEAHSGIPTNEWVDALSHLGHFTPIFPPFDHDEASPLSALHSKTRGQSISLEAALFWNAYEHIDEPDPDSFAALNPDHLDDADHDAYSDFIMISANVNSLYPAQEVRDALWMPSAQRMALADAFDDRRIMIAGIQESRTRTSGSSTCGRYTMWRSAAQDGQAGVELWLHASLPATHELVVVHRDPRRLLAAFHLGLHKVMAVVLYAPIGRVCGGEALVE